MSEKPISPLRRRMIEDMTVRDFVEKTFDARRTCYNVLQLNPFREKQGAKVGRQHVQLYFNDFVLTAVGSKLDRRFTSRPLIQARARPQPMRGPDGIEACVAAGMYGSASCQ
jgi:hypothetical protein